jgi:hypothetical protein
MTCYQHLREDQFERIASALPEYAGNVGRPVQDNRFFVEAVIWIGRNGGGGAVYLRSTAKGVAFTSVLNAGRKQVFCK